MRVSLSFLVPFTLVAAAVAARAIDPVPLQLLRASTFDLYQKLAPRPYHPGPVRVIDIDDRSLDRIGQWPWPRPVVADMIDRLRTAGAVVVALDIVFAEHDRTSPSRILSLWPKIPETEALRAAAAAGRLPDHDDVLAATIARGKVVTGFAARSTTGNMPVRKAGIATIGTAPLGRVPRLPGALTSLPGIQTAAAGNGALTMIPDPDGILRRVPLVLAVGDTAYPALAAEALRVAQGAKTYVARAASPGRLGSLVIGAHVVPTDASGQIWLYDTGPVARRIIPAWKVMEGAFAPSSLSGAIVFIGSSATAIEDVQHTPLNTATRGVTVHAQAVEQILSRSYLTRPYWADALEIIVMTLVGVISILVLRRLSAITGFAFAATVIVSIIALCWLAFTKGGLLLAPGSTVLTMIAVYLSSTVIAYLVSERRRREIRSAFRQYLSPALVEKLAANPGLLTLGGETREVTIMFCDIRGFTAISEKLDAEALTRLVNRFMTAMTGAILDHGGTIDKYIGDCVMAFWNAPLDDPVHARHACDAALAMRTRLRELNDALQAEAQGLSQPFAPLRMGIGINTDRCCVGNTGSAQRFNYSVLGDGVNLAARLEEETANFGVDIVVGEATRTQVPDLPFRDLGRITVRGRIQPVGVFTMPDEAAATPP